MKKVCTKCNRKKKVKKFGVDNRAKDNLLCICKKCDRLKSFLYRRTKDGVVTKIYNNQILKSKKRGHSKPTYSRKELSEWLYSQPLFHKLFDNWKRLDYQINYVPSVDRKEDYLGYTMSNIQLMTWGENNKKGYVSKEKSVNQLSLKGNFIANFKSITEANLFIEVKTGVGSVCRGEKKSAGGFKWEFCND